MPIPVSIQALIFLYSVAGGIAIAFVYDIFRIKRKTVKTSNFITYVEDIIYWLIVALIMFVVLYYGNEGEIRGYIFIGAIIGVILYALLLSRIIMKILLTTIKILGIIIRETWRVISYPFKIIFRILRIPARFLLRQSKKIFRKARKLGRKGADKAALWKRIFRNTLKKI
ncbi:MAG TPA: spore cortex biosynthesis protein YabQ [Clostridiaceae bacterium]|nr:spore cortex biosynthesis protein YabQ [Clostridiaceae bacterium]